MDYICESWGRKLSYESLHRLFRFLYGIPGKVSKSLRGGVWTAFGAIILIAIYALMFAVVITTVLGVISVSPLLIVGFVLVILFSGIGMTQNPENVQQNIATIISRALSGGSRNRNGTPHEEKASESAKTGFERIVEVADEESTELADHLRRMRSEYDDVTSEDVAQAIELGLHTQRNPPIIQVQNRMQELLDARDFVKESDDHELRVIQRENETLYARITENQAQPPIGLKLELYVEEAIGNDGVAELLPKHIGTAQVILAEEQFCGLEVVSWTDQFNHGESERWEYIMSHNPTARFDEEVINNVEWDSLEETHDHLKKLTTERDISYAN